MRIAAVLSVKDEAELIERSVEHLWAIGVDVILAFDMGSRDGTVEALERLQSTRLQLFRWDDRDPDTSQIEEATWSAVRHCGADWVLFQDADEFWLPASGRLQDCAALNNADVLSVDRFNVVLGSAGPLLPAALTPSEYPRCTLIVKSPPDFRSRLEQDDSLAWIGIVPGRKAMARRHCVARLIEGLHEVEAPPGMAIRRQVPDDLLIAHLPLSTPERFAAKVENIRAHLAVHAPNMGPQIAWHWRRWLRLEDEGRLAQEFERSVFDPATLEHLRAEGVVQSAAQWFDEAAQRGRAPGAAAPTTSPP